ncbi:hypothetical protein KP509_14G045700 [Ceratopteris richardii]|uniref:Uncharacterized protein n=1 Tax=Ceratopteris richardii TaxID=49495 RepID=A0A8T2T7K1_CERRI|nr:hypothetical protein KP509_14G045400 [Ceratopteris richardii]KAH7415469.1 hypothetical protein KP509_14G045700 [Ceratopteris richardii]
MVRAQLAALLLRVLFASLIFCLPAMVSMKLIQNQVKRSLLSRTMAMEGMGMATEVMGMAMEIMATVVMGTATGPTAMAIKVINRGDRLAAAVNIRSYGPMYQYDVPAAIRSESLGSLVLVNFLGLLNNLRS